MQQDHDQDRRASLEPFARDAVAELDTRGAAVRPDFAAMMARARALVAETEARPLAPVIPIVAGFAVEGERGAGLAPFTAALRDELDQRVQERGLAGIPPLRATVSRGGRVGVVLGVFLAAAAALLLVLGGDRLVRRVDGTGHAASAAATSREDRQAGVARSGPPPPRDRAAPAEPRSSETPTVQTDALADKPVITEQTAEQPIVGRELRPDPAPLDPPRPRRAARTPRPVPTEPPPPTLEEEAQALWQRGELAAAEQKFREVLRVADGRRAELAFGDLFALVRQMHGADGQATVWREYLRRFPRGRFAEDAHAGLCQRATGEARATCWQEYLAQHPDGAHRSQAEAAGGTP